jgi:hypothetical protein
MLRGINRHLDLNDHSPIAEAVLQLDRPTVGRSRADDPHADRRLLHGHPVRAPPLRGGPSQSGLSLVSLGGHGLSTPLFSAGQVGSARKGSGFFACSTPGGVGGQDGLRRIGRPSSATRPAGKCRTVATSDAGSSDPRPLPGAPFRLVGGTPVFACVRPFLSCGRHRHSARVRPPEVSSVGPHPVHDHGEPACEGGLRPFHAASLRDPHGPGSER